jgi:hypothetical protein
VTGSRLDPGSTVVVDPFFADAVTFTVAADGTVTGSGSSTCARVTASGTDYLGFPLTAQGNC